MRTFHSGWWECQLSYSPSLLSPGNCLAYCAFQWVFPWTLELSFTYAQSALSQRFEGTPKKISLASSSLILCYTNASHLHLPKCQALLRLLGCLCFFLHCSMETTLRQFHNAHLISFLSGITILCCLLSHV